MGAAWRRLRRRLGGDPDDSRVLRTYARLAAAATPAALAGGGVAYAITKALGNGAPGSLVALLAGGSVLLGVFTAIAHLMRLPEVSAMVGMVRGCLGR